MSKDDIDSIRRVAEAELKAERIREAIDKCKEQLRKTKWYHRLFPFRIVFIRREVC